MSRLPSDGRIDRTRPIHFTFNGIRYDGYTGDTLASALLANNVGVVAHSVTYGRPRGIFSAGVEEPNALVQVGNETMLRATQVELVEGLEASGLNGRGRLLLDAPSPSGGGQGGGNRYDKIYAHCEVLVIGGGRAGITAALEAAQTGDRVILVDEQAELGGRLLSAGWSDWLADGIAALESAPDVRVLTRATAFGHYDQNLVLIAERLENGGRLWQVRAKRVVLATGAHERPLIFANNDRPGIMLAGAARTYVNRYGVAPGKRAVIFTNNDSTDVVAADLKRAGIIVEAVIDVRVGEAVVDTSPSPARGGGQGGGLHGVIIATLTGDGPRREVECDLLCLSAWRASCPTSRLQPSRSSVRPPETWAVAVRARSCPTGSYRVTARNGRPTSSTSSVTSPSRMCVALWARACSRSSTSSALRRSAQAATRARRPGSTRPPSSPRNSASRLAP